MLGSYVRDFFILSFSLIMSVVVVATGVSGMKAVRSLGRAMTQNRVNQEAVENNMEFSGIDSARLSRDESVALTMNYCCRDNFEVALRYAGETTRDEVINGGRLYNKEMFLNNPEKFTVDNFNKSFKADDNVYIAFLAYNGEDPTLISGSHYARKGDIVTGITLIMVGPEVD